MFWLKVIEDKEKGKFTPQQWLALETQREIYSVLMIVNGDPKGNLLHTND